VCARRNTTEDRPQEAESITVCAFGWSRTSRRDERVSHE